MAVRTPRTKLRAALELVPADPIDWPAVLARIDLTDAALSALLADAGYKFSRVSITELRAGKGAEPRYSVGAALLDAAGLYPNDAPTLARKGRS